MTQDMQVGQFQDFLGDGGRLLRAAEAMRYLGDMSRTAFYRNIMRGIIPKPRYIGKSPVWRLEDLREVYERLPQKVCRAKIV